MVAAQITPLPISAVPALAGATLVAAAGTLPALCPFRVWSGHACPLCGMTRAAGSLARGDVSTALLYHPLVLLLALEVAMIGLVYGRTRSRPYGSMMQWLVPVNAVTFAAVWLLRWRLDLLSFVDQ